MTVDEQWDLRTTGAYLVYERQEGSTDRLRGIFPATDGGVKAAIAFGQDEFESFSAAEAGDEDGYLTKRHGIVVLDGPDSDRSGHRLEGALPDEQPAPPPWEDGEGGDSGR